VKKAAEKMEGGGFCRHMWHFWSKEACEKHVQRGERRRNLEKLAYLEWSRVKDTVSEKTSLTEFCLPNLGGKLQAKLLKNL